MTSADGVESGSIIERFRGTQWDAQPPPAPAGPPPARRGPSVALIAGGLVLLLLAAGVGGTLVLQSAAAPTPTVPVLTTVGPTPTKAPGDDIVASFWTVVDDYDASYHLDSAGSLATKGSDQRFAQRWTLSLDVAADNYVGVLSIAGRGRFTFDRFDGVIYLRKAGTSKWEKTPTSDRSFRQSPFMALDDHRELTYAGSVTENGRALHRLISTDAYRPSVARLFALAWFEFPFTAVNQQLELFVTDKGVPVRATYTCTVRADPAHHIPGFSGTARFTFSAFGQGPKISAPPTH